MSKVVWEYMGFHGCLYLIWVSMGAWGYCDQIER